jgi:Tfp pilus assembly protein PilP
MFPRMLALAVMLGFAGSSLAQAPPASPAPDSSQAPALAGGEPVKDTIKSILDQELEPPPGGYTYNPGGRRDPFVSLQKPVEADRGPKTRKPGMEGFLIQEVALKGIVRSQQEFIAMLLGTDGKSYFVKVGQRLFDGGIIAIDGATVTFRQEVTDPLSPVRTREIKKTLYPSEEARQ